MSFLGRFTWGLKVHGLARLPDPSNFYPFWDLPLYDHDNRYPEIQRTRVKLLFSRILGSVPSLKWNVYVLENISRECMAQFGLECSYGWTYIRDHYSERLILRGPLVCCIIMCLFTQVVPKSRCTCFGHVSDYMFSMILFYIDQRRLWVNHMFAVYSTLRSLRAYSRSSI